VNGSEGSEGERNATQAVCHITIIVAALGLLLGGKLAEARAPVGSMGMAKVPRKRPDFTLLNIDGQQVSLQQYRGSGIPEFRATWCIPCREEMAALERLHQTYQAQDLAIISIDLKEGADQVKAFFRSTAYPSLTARLKRRSSGTICGGDANDLSDRP
jgi:thiol-disulfide isomerase/thioredoxin